MFRILHRICPVAVPQMRTSSNIEVNERSFHTLRALVKHQDNFNPISSSIPSTLLTSVQNVQHMQICGLKYVGKVHRRCKDCNLMLIAGVMHNHCKTHPRHNQKAKSKRPKSTWIVTAAIQTKIRPW